MSNHTVITKHFEFDAGHRVPSHDSICRNPHGHRYKLDVTVGGRVLGVRQQSDDGMIIDFGELKRLVTRHVITPWDHSFLVYEGDTDLIQGLQGSMKDRDKLILLPDIPTAENLAFLIAEILKPVIQSYMGNDIWLDQLVLYETPNSWASVHCDHWQ